MLKKLVIGTLVTGIVLTGGIGASATTFESNSLADSKVKNEIARYDIELKVGEKKRVSGSWAYSEFGDGSVFKLTIENGKYYVKGLNPGTGGIVVDGKGKSILVTE
ncbi:hypothetical protein [Bacillus cereus group sp. BfR-BA-01453]|uniref:hypothetical protein n=1 Tax=Bacillus cereus group sp. BfR-BA-01453 TaxID=2920355 RepID=UPI001F57C60C|nr:hypothetical protein [Bacillus cereus group sp. BfR-BA-01453]